MNIRPTVQKTISVSLPQTLIDDIDRRADSLELPRSKYLKLLAQRDLRDLGPLTIYGREAEKTEAIELADEDYAFLKAAMPQLELWENHLRQGTPMPAPSPSPTVNLQVLWHRFLDERRSILVHKWIESEKAGHDIGIERAILDWLRLNPPPPS